MFAHALKLSRLLFLALLFTSGMYTLSATANTFNAETFTLSNGMQVVLIPNHKAPVVTHMLWIKAGSAYEEPGTSGIAHFLEHLMFKGTEKYPAGTFSTTVKKLGGEHNAFTSWDYTAYFESISVDHFETVMDMEADRFQHMNPPEEEVLSERDVIMEERRQSIENKPQRLFSDNLKNALFRMHPYGRPIIGWSHEMAQLDKADALAFHDDWYTPENAILVVGGAVTRNVLEPLAEKIYGSIPAHEGRTPPQAIYSEYAGNTIIEKEDPNVHSRKFYKLYRVPSLTTHKDDALALDVLTAIMANSTTSRLYKSLVVDQKLATQIYISYDNFRRDNTSFSIVANPAENTSFDELSNAIDAEITKIIRDGVTEDERKRAVNNMQADAIYALDSLSGPAMIVGRALATGVSLDDVETWVDQIAAVDANSLQMVADKYLNPKTAEHTVIGKLSPPLAPSESEAADNMADETSIVNEPSTDDTDVQDNSPQE